MVTVVDGPDPRHRTGAKGTVLGSTETGLRRVAALAGLSGRYNYPALGTGLRATEHECANQAIHYRRSEEHTSELQSLMRNSYTVFCLKKKNTIETKYVMTETDHRYITMREVTQKES